jgi:serine protease Do
MRRITDYGPSLAVLVACLATMFLTPTLLRQIGHGQTQARITLATQTLVGDDILERIDRAVSAIGESIIPSVVHIDVQSDWVPEDHPPVGISRSSGSGWVFDGDGHIVTNAHVVRGAERISVQFHDGRIVDGELVGIDPFTDIAVIRANTSSGLFPAPRDSGHIPLQGERVFAFGSPFGFKFSMSEGIISGLGRDPMSSNQFGGFTNFIQTDAAVNPGNSGGPLVSARGKVIGMNVAIATARDGGTGLNDAGGDSAGISFAIPLPTIETVVSQLISSGDVSRGFLGVSFRGAVGFEGRDGRYRRGIRVSVEPGGPSDRAGIRDGDIITSVAGQSVPEFTIFQSIVGTIPANQEVEIEVSRNDEISTIPVVLGELPPHVLGARAQRSILFQLGLRIGDTADGPAIGHVFESSPADRLGFRAGQRILSVAGQSVSSTEDVFALLTTNGLLSAKTVNVRVKDPADAGGEEKTVAVRLGR